jgi:hypothetical protein
MQSWQCMIVEVDHRLAASHSSFLRLASFWFLCYVIHESSKELVFLAIGLGVVLNNAGALSQVLCAFECFTCQHELVPDNIPLTFKVLDLTKYLCGLKYFSISRAGFRILKCSLNYPALVNSVLSQNRSKTDKVKEEPSNVIRDPKSSSRAHPSRTSEVTGDRINETKLFLMSD